MQALLQQPAPVQHALTIVAPTPIITNPEHRAARLESGLADLRTFVRGSIATAALEDCFLLGQIVGSIDGLIGWDGVSQADLCALEMATADDDITEEARLSIFNEEDSTLED